MIRIRQLNLKGSEVKTYSVVDEAEKVIAEARAIGALVVDETTDKVHQGGKLTDEHDYAIFNPIAGG